MLSDTVVLVDSGQSLCAVWACQYVNDLALKHPQTWGFCMVFILMFDDHRVAVLRIQLVHARMQSLRAECLVIPAQGPMWYSASISATIRQSNIAFRNPLSMEVLKGKSPINNWFLIDKSCVSASVRLSATIFETDLEPRNWSQSNYFPLGNSMF